MTDVTRLTKAALLDHCAYLLGRQIYAAEAVENGTPLFEAYELWDEDCLESSVYRVHEGAARLIITTTKPLPPQIAVPPARRV